MKSVKLKSVSVTNYKNIAKVSQEVNGNHFIVFGKNGQGKTSLMEVINRSALRIEPKDMAAMPIKLGAKNAQSGVIYLIEENGRKTEILVETVYRPSGAVMRVVDLSNNGELKPTVDRLQQLIGESHDISPLMDMTGKEQFEFLLKVLGGNQAAQNYEEQYKEKYQERKVLNKQINAKKADIDAIAPPLDVLQGFKNKGDYATKKTPSPQPDKTPLINSYYSAKGFNEKVDSAIAAKKEIDDQIKALQERSKKAEEWIAANPKIDMTEINTKLNDFDVKYKEWEAEVVEVNKYNEVVDSIIAYNEKRADLQKIEGERDKVQRDMDGFSAKMKAAVTSLKIEDLAPELALVNEIDNDGNVKQGLFYKIDDTNLLPFNKRQISYGKMLVALVKLSSYINADKLNIFHIPAWESLDDDSKREVLEFAEANDDLNVQFCIEEVKQELLGIKLVEKTINQ